MSRAYLVNRFIWPVFGLLFFSGSAHAEASRSAQEVATAALESFREEPERKLTTLEFPNIGVVGTPPEMAEVDLIQGYINYTYTRLFWNNGKPNGQRVRLNRTWFYNPKGESYLTEQFDLSSADFQLAWAAAQLLKASTTPSIKNDSPRSDRFTSSVAFTSSSHEQTSLIRLSADSNLPLFEGTVRGKTLANGIQPIQQLRTRAIFKLFNDLLPAPESGVPFDLREWGPFLTQTFTSQCAKDGSEFNGELNSQRSLLLETSLRLLGQMGYAPALPPIRELQATLEKADPKTLPYSKMLLRETKYAIMKIEFQQDFNSPEARVILQTFSRGVLPDRDFVQWLRDHFFEQDPDGYFTFLTETISDSNSSEIVLLECVSDLAKRYPLKSSPLLQPLLANASSEVVTEAALAILKPDGKNPPALKALDRIASDPTASIPERARWFDRFGRERALDYLTSTRSPVPSESRWDMARIQKQLNQPNEDGRMINRLLTAQIRIENRALTDAQQIEAYRRVIKGKLNRGTLDACEQLIKLKDVESAPQIRTVLDETAAHCNQKLSWQPDPNAKYPWVDKSEIERIRADLAKIVPNSGL